MMIIMYRHSTRRFYNMKEGGVAYARSNSIPEEVHD
jgi:hypothetical protein